MKNTSSSFRKRVIITFIIFLVFFACIAIRQLWLQSLDKDVYIKMADDQQKAYVTIKAFRGNILDRKGEPLATSSARKSIVVRPWLVKHPQQAASLLSPVLNQTPQFLLEGFAQDNGYHFLERKASDLTCSRVQALKTPPKDMDPDKFDDPLAGIEIEEELTAKRFYPQGRLASHILGATGTDEQGLGGIEASYNDILSGRHGEEMVATNAFGVFLPVKPKVALEAIPGQNVVLTIDSTVQHIAETALNKQCADFKAKGGICIVLNAKTAEILALAINPDFMPSDFPTVPQDVTRNRAFTDPYEPGSIFKTFVAGAALENGKEPGSVFSCPSSMVIGGWPIGNAHDGFSAGGVETLADIIAYSFNTGTVSVAFDLGKETVGKSLDKFGFGHLTNVGIQGEAEGLLSDWHTWEPVNTATISFGQGVAVTPIQLASAMQAVANDGVRIQPRLVKELVDNEGKVIKQFPAQEIGRPMSPENAKKLRDILVGVVSYGTGKPARVPGYLVAGKTGTAQVVSDGGYQEGRYNAGFLGFAPADDPEIVVFVKLEEPPSNYWGGTASGPVFSNVCKKVLPYLGVSPKKGFKQTSPEGI